MLPFALPRRLNICHHTTIEVVALEAMALLWVGKVVPIADVQRATVPSQRI